MRRLSLSLAVLMSSVLLGMLPCTSSGAAEAAPTLGGVAALDDDSLSCELLIGWKQGVSTAERDRIIAALGGKLVRRLTLVKADTVSFPNVEARDAARIEAANNPAVREVLTYDLLPLHRGSPQAEGRMGGPPHEQESWPESGNVISISASEADSTAGNELNNCRPFESWRYIHRTDESQEYDVQKQEVVVAVIGEEAFETSSYLESLIWENAEEKNGLLGIDDDRNGWIDDINGIDIITPKRQYFHGLTSSMAQLIAKNADYSREYQPNPEGKVKLMLIGAFYCDWDSFDNELYRSTDAAIIESLDYAASMRADVIVIQGYHDYQGSALLLDALQTFSGLIVTASASTSTFYPLKEPSILVFNDIPHIIRVSAVDGTAHWGIERIDLWANASRPIYAACVVGGVAAHLMSCYPHVGRYQIRDMILGSIDQSPYDVGKSSAGGSLNAARAALGRSTGGCFYVGDWARIDRFGPPSRYLYSAAYDSKHGNMYIYGGTSGGKDYDDFWVWDGKGWREIQREMTEGAFSRPRANSFMQYIESRDEILIVDISNEWRWDGNSWHYRSLTRPQFVDSYSREFTIDYRDTIYDSTKDRIVHYARLSPLYPFSTEIHFIEYKRGEWRDLNIGGRIPGEGEEIDGHYADVAYNSRSGRVTVFEVYNRDNADKLWEYAGHKWQFIELEDICSQYGIYLYDQIRNEFVMYDPYFSSWSIGEVNSFNGKHWRRRGYDKLNLRDGYHGFWAGDRGKFLIIGEPIMGAGRLSVWQYSGSITPTWIDNLILPQSDYTGDGKADPALWRPRSGKFFDTRGRLGPKEGLGRWGDTPALGDYDGDGNIDYVVCRRLPSKPRWGGNELAWVFSDETVTFGWFDDIPVPADYDGDGNTDIAVFRKDTGEWIVLNDPDFVGVGGPADLPVPADYDGDGRAEPATYTPLTSTWHIRGLGDFQFGSPGDSPVPADYDGDGRKDIATWNPRKRLWLVRSWKDGSTQLRVVFGRKWDIPVPGDYDGDGCADIATFTPIQGLWSIRGQEPIHFGRPGDVPLVRGN